MGLGRGGRPSAASKVDFHERIVDDAGFAALLPSARHFEKPRVVAHPYTSSRYKDAALEKPGSRHTAALPDEAPTRSVHMKSREQRGALMAS